MTVTEQSSRKVIVGAGWANPLTSPYVIEQAAHVHVFADAVELVQGVDYTVTNVLNPAGYAVTITNPGSWAPTNWVLDARPPIDQGKDLTVGGTFGAKYEDGLDKLTRRVERVWDLARRGLKTGLGVAVGDNPYTLPAPAADKLIGWNAAGDDLENHDPVAIGIALVDNDTALAADSATRVPSQHAVKTYADAAKAAAIASAAADATTKANAAAAAAIAIADAYADTNKLAKSQNLNDVADKVASQNNLNYQRVPANATYAIIASMTKMSQRADLRDWAGLDLTGATDMASIVQAAVTATAAAGQVLYIPAGNIKLSSSITVPKGANIQGPGQPADRSGTVSSNAAFFHLAHLNEGFILDGNNDGPRRLAGFGTYRDQAAPGGGWVPIGALADVLITGCYDAIVEDLFFYNPTTALRVTGKLTGGGLGNGRLTLRRLRGQPLSAGLTMTHIYDCIYVDDIHWWPYWSQDTNVTSYTKASAFAVILGRVDWPLFGRVFSWGLGTGLHIQNQASVGFDGGLPAGTTQHLHADSLNFDNTERGLVVASGSNLASYNIDSLIATNTVYAASAMITVLGDNSSGQIGNLYGANADGNLVTLTGTGNKLRIGASRSSGIDHDASGTPEFNVATGNRIDIGMKPITSAATVYAFAGTGRISSPDWINFTPTITASSGTITTVAAIAAGDCKYKLEGTTCTFDYTFTITTNGTGAGTLLATLPFNSKKSTAGPAGRAGVNTISGVCQSGVARVDMNKVDGTYPGADATTIRISGSYEIA